MHHVLPNSQEAFVIITFFESPVNSRIIFYGRKLFIINFNSYVELSPLSTRTQGSKWETLLCVYLTIRIIDQITKLRASRFQRFLNIDTEFITYKPQGVKTKTKQRSLVETVLILPRTAALRLLYRK